MAERSTTMQEIFEVETIYRKLKFEKTPTGITFFAPHSHEEKSEQKPAVDNPLSGKQGWEASEHKFIGTKAFMEFCQSVKINQQIDLQDHLESMGLFDAGSQKICLTDFPLRLKTDGKEKQIHIELTPGDIVALAGDFSGVPDQPISFGKGEVEQKELFWAAYLTLAAPTDKKKYEKLVKQIDEEFKVIKKYLAKGLKPSMALEENSDASNRKYGSIMQYTYLPWTYYLYSEYTALASWNFDHFQAQAEQTYKAGHETAIETAKAAHLESDEGRKWKLFMLALTQELWALHFLTDLFSAGHMRTPRKELYDYAQTQSSVPLQYGRRGIAGLLAQIMHDEDNHIGLEVTRKIDGATWRAFGDKCYFDPENRTATTLDDKELNNHDIVLATVKVALAEVYEAFVKGDVNVKIYDYIPRPTENNFAPLFKLISVNGKNIIQYRMEVCNPTLKEKDARYTNLVDFVKTWLEKRPAPGHTLTTDEKRELEKELEMFVEEKDTDNKRRCTIL